MMPAIPNSVSLEAGESKAKHWTETWCHRDWWDKYADDVDIIRESEDQVQEMYNAYKEAAKRVSFGDK